jgi:uncharacterized protein YkwD
MRRMVLILIFILLGATFLRGWQSSSAATHPAPSGCSDVAASPDYLESNSEQDAIAAINNARAGEHLPALRLPDNFYQLDPAQQQFVLINLERTDRSLKPLRLDANLSQIARNYSRQLRDLHFFSHTSPIAGTFSERIDSNATLAGHYALAAENLAGNPVPGVGTIYEYMYDDSVEACGHRANILDPHVSLVGIGWVPGSAYGSISAQEFIGPASWNPYRGAPPIAQSLHLSITVGTRFIASACASKLQQHKRNIDTSQRIHYQPVGWSGWWEHCGKNASLESFHAQLQHDDGNARITWFLDRVGNLPFSSADITLDLNVLAPGRHTLLVYAVDSEQNYAVATYAIAV